MMRQRLRDLKPRSDLARFVLETFPPEGAISRPPPRDERRRRDGVNFSDADGLSLMFATPLRPMYPDEFKTAEPDWILPSPWLGLSPDLDARVRVLVASGRYEQVSIEAPQLSWQNNPDPLFRDFSPYRGAERCRSSGE